MNLVVKLKETFYDLVMEMSLRHPKNEKVRKEVQYFTNVVFKSWKQDVVDIFLIVIFIRKRNKLILKLFHYYGCLLIYKLFQFQK